MSLDLTLILLLPASVVLAGAVWQVRRRREPGRPSYIDWHYVLFPALLAEIILSIHAANLLLGR